MPFKLFLSVAPLSAASKSFIPNDLPGATSKGICDFKVFYCVLLSTRQSSVERWIDLTDRKHLSDPSQAKHHFAFIWLNQNNLKVT